MLTLNDGRSELWQWDTGRKLTVDADCSQVHFSNKVFGRSIDVDVVDGVAIIPDILLQTDKELTAWAFVGTSENGYTKISKVFKVNRRNKPSDYVFTPPEQTTLSEIWERLDDLDAAQDPDAIKNVVDDYLSNNPIEVQETDPTVPKWAKQPTKPIYTASEVGALPADTVIPTVPDNVSAFHNDAGYLTEHQDISGKLDASALPAAISTALAQAKASGEFDGEPGAPGQDYVLTDADKSEIAEMAADLVEVPEVPEASMKPLTFTGAVNATYDGSEAVSVEIPEGGGGSGRTIRTLVSDTLTEAVTNYKRALTKEEVSEINKASFVRITLNTHTVSHGKLSGVNFYLWSNYSNPLGNIGTIEFDSANSGYQVAMLCVWLVEDRKTGVSQKFAETAGIRNHLNTVQNAVFPYGFGVHTDTSIEAKTTTDAGFPIGTTITLEVG